jgi:hypothetical protein
MDSLHDDEALAPLDEEELLAFAGRIGELPPEQLDWVVPLLLECRRARAAEARLASDQALAELGGNELTQVVLDTAEWLRTLWDVGYMGAASFPTPPRTRFPTISSEDVVRSALLARIRQGKHPLPFPPPTREGVPWHEVVESDEIFPVRAQVSRGPEGDWVSIEGCAEWQLIHEDQPARSYRVQHRYKGPVYQLQFEDGGSSTLRRCPPTIHRRLLCQSRAGVDAFLLEWPKDDGDTLRVPLPAATWERAEDEARRWVAVNHPSLYGQIAFERCTA